MFKDRKMTHVRVMLCRLFHALSLAGLAVLTTGFSAKAEPIALRSVVTPSAVIVKDGRTVTFAIHGFIEFSSLKEAFAYIESQRERWKKNISEQELHALGSGLLREAVESRVVSMVDEQPLEALVDAHERGIAGGDCAGQRADATRICGGVSGGAGKVEPCAELLERFARGCRTRTVDLVSD